ncbi:hypothetical protein PVK06_038600 [Gossypium arboreum]|uniref:DUF4283 domain-containing protein n=1 Tax=Gossypium arboreum TaxID=29729 RepID=A0ABR0N129_GOSAR|nr:hypothetical protein PVK06_038600 [Gossypium arboreum]
MAGEEISLLADELIQLTVKSSFVTPKSQFSLLCSVWTKKNYNSDSLCTQLRSIWKTRRKFGINAEGQNLFQIYFEDEDDLEMILDGRPWYFRKQLIIFDRLKEGVKRSKIKLVFSPFRLRVGSCPPECEKKDLMHAIGSTFGGILRSKIQNEICRMKVMVGARKPLRRGIFVAVGDSKRVWLPFKYESLPNFYFGCGIMGHNVKDCTEFLIKREFWEMICSLTP